MPDRILSTCSAATVLAALFFFAGQDAAQASRCPLGEIYRPSRGICVSKERAIQAGIYRGASHVSATRAAATSVAASHEPEAQAAPKPRAQALAAIERRAPVTKTDEALAFTADRKQDAVTTTTQGQVKNPQITPIVFRKPAPSPFGSLVALEPLP